MPCSTQARKIGNAILSTRSRDRWDNVQHPGDWIAGEAVSKLSSRATVPHKGYSRDTELWDRSEMSCKNTYMRLGMLIG